MLVLAAAAHEIKTPLAVIAGYTDFLLGSHAGPLNDVQKSVLVEMQQSALRLSGSSRTSSTSASLNLESSSSGRKSAMSISASRKL